MCTLDTENYSIRDLIENRKVMIDNVQYQETDGNNLLLDPIHSISNHHFEQLDWRDKKHELTKSSGKWALKLA